MSSLAHEPGPFGQRHDLELHGSGGTLRAMSDWLTVQRVDGCRATRERTSSCPSRTVCFAGARQDTVHSTYRDVFRLQGHQGAP